MMAKSSASIKVAKTRTVIKTRYKIPKLNTSKGNPNKCQLCGKFTKKA